MANVSVNPTDYQTFLAMLAHEGGTSFAKSAAAGNWNDVMGHVASLTDTWLNRAVARGTSPAAQMNKDQQISHWDPAQIPAKAAQLDPNVKNLFDAYLNYRVNGGPAIQPGASFYLNKQYMEAHPEEGKGWKKWIAPSSIRDIYGLGGERHAFIQSPEYKIPDEVTVSLGNGLKVGDPASQSFQEAQAQLQFFTHNRTPYENRVDYVPIGGPPPRPGTGLDGIVPRSQETSGLADLAKQIGGWVENGVSGLNDAIGGAGSAISDAFSKAVTAGSSSEIPAFNNYGAIADLYQKDLGRSPDADGLNYWMKELQSGKSLFDIDRGIQASPEAQKYLANTDWQYGNNHQGNPNSLDPNGPAGFGAGYPVGDALNVGSHGTEDLSRIIGLARAQFGTSGADKVPAYNDYAAINALYQQDVGRNADVDGLNYWARDLQSGKSLMDIDQGLKGSAESKAYLSMPSTATQTYDPASGVGAAYNAVLGRAPDATGGDYYSQALQNGSMNLAGLMDALRQSPEYAQTYGAPSLTPTQGPGGLTPTQGPTGATPTEAPRLSQYRDTINDAYQATLQRAPDAAGVDYFSQALQNGSLAPSALEQALMQSPEYAQTHPAQQIDTQAPGVSTPTIGPNGLTPTQAAPNAIQAWDAQSYLNANPDVAASHVDPLTHFLTYGQGEGRSINTLGQKFDGNAYLAQNQDVARAGLDPWLHYLTNGAREGRAADLIGPDGTTQVVNNWLDASTLNNAEYAPIVNNATQAAHVWSPAPTPTYAAPPTTPTVGFNGFNAQAYLGANPDVAAADPAGVSPQDWAVQHFLNFGQYEDRPLTLDGVKFDGKAYLAQNPDVARAGMSPLQHYLGIGKTEGRANPFEGLGGFDFSNLNVGNFGLPGLGSLAPKNNFGLPAVPSDNRPLGSGITYNNGSVQYGGVDIGAGALFDPYSSEQAYLNTQVDQINSGAQHAANVALMLTGTNPNAGYVPMPTFAVNGTSQSNGNAAGAAQTQHLNNVNTALAAMAPVAPSGASFLPKPVMSGPFW